jgi:hypothetical protein
MKQACWSLPTQQHGIATQKTTIRMNECSSVQVDIAIEELERYKSLGYGSGSTNGGEEECI